MAIRLPKQWPAQVKSGILHAISLAVCRLLLSAPRSPDNLRLAISYVEGRKHLPVIELRRAA